jgi:hypothetical protein
MLLLHSPGALQVLLLFADFVAVFLHGSRRKLRCASALAPVTHLSSFAMLASLWPSGAQMYVIAAAAAGGGHRVRPYL